MHLASKASRAKLVALAFCLVLAIGLPVAAVGAQRLPSDGLTLDRRVGQESRLIERRVIGLSVLGREIEAFRYGTEGGTVVLVVGVIHGDEAAGLQITDVLRTLQIQSGVDLWIIPSVNPDGTVAATRGNANRVDLNRNFPRDWAAQGGPGYWQYAGASAASEPETRAVVRFVRDVKPVLGIWYHQDLNMISPGTGFEGRVRARYATLTGLPLVRITGGRYTGVAATWQRNAVPKAVGFVVELGPTLSAAQARTHAIAVLAVAKMVQKARLS
ncbi:MAG: M14 family zinc carboxypeptidase [Actinomycetota bacterium]